MIVAESATAWLERYPRSSDGSEGPARYRVCRNPVSQRHHVSGDL